MNRLRLLVAVVLLVGCGGTAPIQVPRTYGLVIANESRAPVYWSVEQPNGQLSRFEVAPCGSTSESVEVGRAWEVEWGATFAITSADVRPLNAPVTVIHVRFDAGGDFDVAAPRPAETQPDAPIDLACVGP